MEIDYLDRDLRRAVTVPGGEPPGWTAAEVARARLVVQCVHASVFVNDLLSIRAFVLKQDRDDPELVITGLSSCKTLTLALKSTTPPTAVLGIATSRTDSAR